MFIQRLLSKRYLHQSIKHNHHQSIKSLSTITGESTITPHPSDFNHHSTRIARLNHGSFGACPKPVLDIQNEYRNIWLEQPDALYFSGKLHQGIRDAAIAAGTTLIPTTKILEPEHLCLTENATVAACAIAKKWGDELQTGDVIVVFDVAYKAMVNVLKEYCVSRGASLHVLHLPFLATTEEEIVEAIRLQMIDLPQPPKYAFLDHVSSQPAVCLPIKPLIEIIREHGQNNMEIAVDGAHSVGSVPNLDVIDMNCDYFFSNLHKWAFAPSTSTILWSKHLPNTKHPIVSWAWGEGMSEESLFPGTRDFSSYLAVPAAIEYLNKWENDGMNSQEYCHYRVSEAADKLRFEWNTEYLEEGQQNGEMEDSLIATQAMVRLPDELIVNDVPGQVGKGVRDVLREEYNIEAAIGNFGDDKGSFVRLSFGVYNHSKDIRRLSNAVLEIIDDQ